ncbi:hypothetical protein [Rhodococcus tukisamuensis]|uniref:Polysaccharide lyase n=1 Tax=Rhodococcus tukisamuensis TaxID=168276 RepID=A0A1G7B2Z8_9NOCA|nr:hypothetical protein [Rhodococcus tukisamuensis]SDE21488.1 hypothetical protein SAMN05444580_11256 [Rhodococcus tukisamuensis]
MSRKIIRKTGIAAAVALAAVGLSGCLAPGTPPGWSSYTIERGAHSATVGRPAGVAGPLAGWVSPGGASRTYDFVLTPTAEYVLTAPTQPEDQFDWNKLPGFSDCGDIDLARNGAMFGWRWRTDTSPRVLELVPYANADGVHQYPDSALVTLSHDDLAANAPLRYSIQIDGSVYRFAIDGTIRGRDIHETATLPRSCPTNPTSTGKWYAGFYFGGTSTSPSQMYAYVREPAGGSAPGQTGGDGSLGSSGPANRLTESA